MFTSKNISVNINNNSSLYLLGFPFVVLFNSNENHFMIHFDAIKKLCGYKKCRGDIDQEHFINTYRRYIYIYMGHVRYALLVFLFRFFPLSLLYIFVYFIENGAERRREKNTNNNSNSSRQTIWLNATLPRLLFAFGFEPTKPELSKWDKQATGKRVCVAVQCSPYKYTYDCHSLPIKC